MIYSSFHPNWRKKILSAATIVCMCVCVCVGGAGTQTLVPASTISTTRRAGCLPGVLLDVRVFAQLVTQQHVLVL